MNTEYLNYNLVAAIVNITKLLLLIEIVCR